MISLVNFAKFYKVAIFQVSFSSGFIPTSLSHSCPLGLLFINMFPTRFFGDKTHLSEVLVGFNYQPMLVKFRRLLCEETSLFISSAFDMHSCQRIYCQSLQI